VVSSNVVDRALVPPGKGEIWGRNSQFAAMLPNYFCPLLVVVVLVVVVVITAAASLLLSELYTDLK